MICDFWILHKKSQTCYNGGGDLVSFDYTSEHWGKWEKRCRKSVYHQTLMTFVIPTNHPKSVCNSCVIKALVTHLLLICLRFLYMCFWDSVTNNRARSRSFCICGYHYTCIYFWYLIFITYAVRVSIFISSPLGVAVGLLSIYGGLFTNF